MRYALILLKYVGTTEQNKNWDKICNEKGSKKIFNNNTLVIYERNYNPSR